MRAAMFLVLTLVASACAEPPKAAPKVTDEDQLVGVWCLVSVDSEMGQATGEQLNRYKLALTGRKYLVSTDQPVSGGYVVDASRRVKTMDLDPADGPNKGKITRGIYQLDGDTLRICQGQPGTERPAEFPVKPSQGLFVMVFKRLIP